MCGFRIRFTSTMYSIFSVVRFWCRIYFHRIVSTSCCSVIFTTFKGHLTMLKCVCPIGVGCMHSNCHKWLDSVPFFVDWGRHLRDTFFRTVAMDMTFCVCVTFELNWKKMRTNENERHAANENYLSIRRRRPPCFRLELTFCTCVLSFRKLPIIYLSVHIVYCIIRLGENK